MFFYLVWCWIFICVVNAQDIQSAAFSKAEDASVQVPAGTRALLSLSYAGGKTEGPFRVVELNGVRIASRVNLPALQGILVPFSLSTFNTSLVSTSLARWIAFLDCDGPRQTVERTLQNAAQLGAGAALVYTSQEGLGGYCQFDITSTPSLNATRIPIYTLIDTLTGTIPRQIQSVQDFYQTEYPAGLNVTALDKMARSSVIDLARLNSGQARNMTTVAVLGRVFNEDSVSSDSGQNMFMEPELERERPNNGGTGRSYGSLSQFMAVAGTVILSSFLAFY